MVLSDLFAFSVATNIKESAFVEKFQDKSVFSYSQAATIITQVFFEVLLTENYFKPIELVLDESLSYFAFLCNVWNKVTTFCCITKIWETRRTVETPIHPRYPYRGRWENGDSIFHTTCTFGGNNYIQKDFSEP